MRFPKRIAERFRGRDKLGNQSPCEVGSCKEIAQPQNKGSSIPRDHLRRKKPQGARCLLTVGS